MSFEASRPQVGRDVFVAPTATVLGQVWLGDAASVWYGSVLRGDVGQIRVGARTNIQDACVLHVTGGVHDTEVGDDVTVGHRVVLHGCRIASQVLVGMGAVIMDDVEVGERCLIAAGSLLPPGKKIPPGSMVMGAPGKVVRPLTDAEVAHIAASAAHYVELAARHGAAARLLSGR
ncbi:MAG TPA: gamma carbonic anhydrase family protein [Myxococcota bacterium]|nr:gamma carbonic anhydrase family protein [Myxococcota bacterium]